MEKEMQMDLTTAILSAISKRVNYQSFNTWFKPISSADKDETSVYLKVPSEVFRDWIVNNYTDIIEESLEELELDGYSIQFLIEDKTRSEEKVNNIEKIYPLHRLQTFNSHQSNNFGIAKPLEIDPIELPLNPKYTFETFVVGSCNQFAHAASLAVVDMPSKTYNPLYIYGGVGLGKTHLMHAIGHSIKSRNKSAKLTYISSEKFMN